MKKCLTLFFLACSVPLLLAQNTATLSGTVQSGDGAVPGASVAILNTTYGTVADREGRFSLTGIRPGQYTVAVTAVGFARQTRSISVASAGNQTLDFRLTESTAQLEEVVVSAQKREEVLQNTPVPVTALTARQIELYQLRTLSDLPALAPNLNVVDAGAPQSQIPSIRGFNSFVGEPAVGIYVDGVVQIDGNFLNEQFVDVERIEVLRGPQGTLYGRNAIGGVINIVTKKPTNRLGGRAEAGLGNFGQQRYAANLNVPLLKDKLFLKTAGVYERRDGFFTNAFNNRRYDGFQRYAASASLLWLPAARWSVRLDGNLNVDDFDGTYPYHTSIQDLRQNGYTINLSEQQAMRRNLYRTSLTVNHYGEKLNFTSISSFSRSVSDLQGTLFEGDFSPADFLKFDYTDRGYSSSVAMQEFRVASAEKGQKLQWIVGFNGFYQRREEGITTIYGNDVPLPQTERDPIPNSQIINYAASRNYGAAVFGQATYQFTERFNVTAGIRYDYESRQATTSFDFLLPPNPQLNTQPENTVSADFNAITPKLTLQYVLNPNVNLFATYARGFRAGGMNVYTSDPRLRQFTPEFSNNYELGVKTTLLDNKLRANLTGFVINWRDKQVQTPLPVDGGGFQQAILNTGLLNAQGVELELSYLVFKNLQLDYNLGYTRAIYRDLPVSETQNLRNNTQPFQPLYTSMLAVQYGFGKKDWKGFVRGEWRALGRQYFDFENVSLQDPYSLFNAKAGLNYKNYGLELWVRNLTGERYIQFGYAQLGFANFLLGAPRTFGATVSARF